jgi:hypothetical protein
MGDWISLQTFVAFVLGVMLSAAVHRAVSGARAKVGV